MNNRPGMASILLLVLAVPPGAGNAQEIRASLFGPPGGGPAQENRPSEFVPSSADEIRRLPPVFHAAAVHERPSPPTPVAGAFPPLPPAPTADFEPLPPLAEELYFHGGSYLYAPEGDRLNWPRPEADHHYQLLRLPEDWHAPQPGTLFQKFLGADPIGFYPRLKWWPDGFDWEPRLVVYGGYQLFGIVLEENSQRQDLIGHQLLLEIDLRLTGTERLHMQFRPLGRQNTGGSVYQFSDPSGYVDNSTGVPDRWWFEGEVASVFSGWFHNEFIPRDYHVVVGKFPFALHNRLMINDDILGVVVSKNTIYLGNLSNLNVQAFYAPDDVDAFAGASADLFGVHAAADWRHVFIETTYAQLTNTPAGRESYWAALSATKLFGRTTLAGRALLKWGDTAGRGAGELFVLEANQTRVYDHQPLGIEKGVYYATAFRASGGWNSISGGGFDRLRISFAVDPTVTISARRAPVENAGVALGVQLFRHHEDESITPEVAFESPGGAGTVGVGLRYQRKTGPRSFFEIEGVGGFSNDPRYRREGIFASQTVLF